MTPHGPRVAIVTRLEGRGDLESLAFLLSCTQAINERWLSLHPEVPGLYSSGIVYRREPRGGRDTAENEERFLTWPSLLIERCGDCDDLAPAFAAELVVRHGIAAQAVPYPTARGFHVVVLCPDGTVFDPSADLGMVRR